MSASGSVSSLSRSRVLACTSTLSRPSFERIVSRLRSPAWPDAAPVDVRAMRARPAPTRFRTKASFGERLRPYAPPRNRGYWPEVQIVVQGARGGVQGGSSLAYSIGTGGYRRLSRSSQDGGREP